MQKPAGRQRPAGFLLFCYLWDPKPKIVYKWLEKYFAFSRRELNGICVLGVLLFALWLISRFSPWDDSSQTTDMASRIEEIEDFLANVTEQPRSSAVYAESKSIQQQAPATKAEYFVFDPNGLSVSDWKRLGLSERQVRVIKNYETKGGRFWKKEDLKKIYSLSDDDYTRLEPYIRIRSTDPKRNADIIPRSALWVDTDEKMAAKDVSPRMSVELNTTDSLELQQLPGIGPVYASRIIRFRDRLGGFHHLSQLMEVYGMDTLRFDGLKEHIYVDSSRVEKIEINLADYERLRTHPFISPKLANAIVQYRKQHGPYRSFSDLLQIAIMNERIFRKIVPYLTISND